MAFSQPEYWNGQADTFDQEPDHGLIDPTRRDAWRALVASVLPPGARTALDLGCGTGTLSLLLAEAGLAVIGIDIAPRMIERAQQKAAAANCSAKFDVGDVADPRTEGTFDVVLCRHVLWALPEPGPAVRRWSSLLNPRGALIAIEGRWSTGGGLTAAEATKLVSAAMPIVEVRPLRDPALWGREVADERYLLVAALP